MPGIITRTAVRSGPTPFEDAEASAFFVAGVTERGPVGTTAELLSLADFTARYGDRVTYGAVYDALQAFFEEGGVRAFVSRVVGPSATQGTLTLTDRAGTPLPVLTLTAAAGDWSSGVTVSVSDSSLAGAFNITISLDGFSESYINLQSAAAAVAAINARSVLVTASAPANATAAPDNIPSVVTDSGLSAGADDRASITAQKYVDALATFTYDLGGGAVAIPGQLAANVGNGLATHAKANNRVFLTAGALTNTDAQDLAAAQAIKATIQSGPRSGDAGGYFAPWVTLPALDDSGVVRVVSPEGYVAGVRARAIIANGTWRAPAGEMGIARYVLSPTRVIDSVSGDNLNENEVNVIRVIAGSTRLYGWRSLSYDEANFALLTGRDTINYIVREAESRLEKYVFRTIDGRGLLFAEIKADMVAMLDVIRADGGLFETEDDLGYSVDTGPSVNTQLTLSRNEAAVALGARVSPTGATIRLLVTKVGIGASV